MIVKLVKCFGTCGVAVTRSNILNFPTPSYKQRAQPAVLSLVILDAVSGFS